MEWKLFSVNESDDINEAEIKDVEISDSDEELCVKNPKATNARRVIEIMREQKQLEADTLDYFDY